MHTVSLGQLSNGLRVVTARRRHLHRAVVSVYLKVGSRNESRRSNGITHFLEHMLFRGTARHPLAADFNHHVETLCGSLNAATHSDFTSFELTLPPDALDDGCETLGRVFVEPTFSAIDVERGIVREEILEDLDDDGRDINADNLIRAQVFRGHPLGRTITGSIANVERFTVGDLNDHLRRFVRAQDAVVSVAGPRSHREMLRAVRRGFDALPSGRAPRSAPFRSSQSRASVRAVPNPGSSQTSVRLGFATPGLHSRSARAIELLSRILDDGMSTRLHRRICDERGMAYEISAGAELFEDVGVFEVSTSVAHRSVAEVVAEVLSILRDLADLGPSDAEVEKAQRRHAFELDALEDDAWALGEFYGFAELLGVRESPAERRRQTLALDAGDVRRAARRCFSPTRLNLALVGAVSPSSRRAIAQTLSEFRDAPRRRRAPGAGAARALTSSASRAAAT